MDLLPMPVTLVIKAPNQKIADQTVRCEMDWTVQRLKNHITEVYPNRPKHHQQKIIYSGKLLSDNVQLKDVLRQYDPDQTTHTVHLVCSTPELNPTKPTVTSQPPASETMASTEGLRHRGNHGNSHSNSHSNPSSSSNNDTVTTDPSPAQQSQSNTTTTTTTSTTSEHSPADFTQAFNGAGQMYNPATSMGVMAPQAAMMPGFPYSPEQMLWFQQMYAQQMAQYMQYYQAAPQQNLQPAVANQNLAAPVGAQVPVGGAPNLPGAGAAPDRDQPMVMNAAGDAVMDDDDENANRDWLDWTYTISRFVVLLSIVYFYSTFSRFILVLGSFVVLYLYQTGWFQLRRRNIRNNQQENAQNNPAEAAAQDADNNSSEEDQNSSDDVVDAETDNAAPPAPAGPSYLRVACSFVLTFFTSLVPQAPQAVNLN